MAVRGSTIIIWFYSQKYREPFLLVGKESKFVSDKYSASSDHGRHIQELESFKPTSGLSETDLYNEISENFRLKSKQLESQLGIGRIHYDTPVFDSATGNYTVHFRYLDNGYKRGLIKGGMEDKESPIDAIIREVGEETGTSITAKRSELVELGVCERNMVFTLDIGDEVAMKKMISNIEQRVAKRKGEVFELSFKQLSQVVPLLESGKFNRKSECAIHLFIDYYNSLHATGASAATASRGVSRARKMSRRRSTHRHNKKTRSKSRSKSRSRK
jgi:hypothetical protein